ncbi:MAG: Dam family site-specific DNA-(adenine-N6)-methyltransferase [Chloroflexi bacterium]|nr:Dam family site-specific DNA-(adenine-N6)-methyltransferase [Chloroflexota bacterium]
MTAVLTSTLPFLKWAGGKQRLMPQYEPYLPPLADIGRYYEAFIGSAALFFHWQPPQATLADRNEKLVEVYRAVQQEVAAVIDALRQHRNDEAYFYAVRGQDESRLSPVERAARLIYLNRTCYNGLYRENSKGKFNVPFGRYKNPNICHEERLYAASASLQGVELMAADFAEVVETAVAGDFIYFDPPMSPQPHQQLHRLRQRGLRRGRPHPPGRRRRRPDGAGLQSYVKQLRHPLVYDLYNRHPYTLITIHARRNINRNGNGRGPIRELLILNY